ncbi:MAG: hypothetical protein WCB67_07630 [Solirubrobacteraceae bacterium]
MSEHNNFDEHDSFEDRVRAIADQISRSMQRMADVDLEQLAEGYGVDVDRARTAASAAGQWLSDRLSSGEPLFGEGQTRDHGAAAQGPNANLDDEIAQATEPGQRSANPGPHPLDLATDRQGLALSALDSRRWTVRPGSDQLAGTGDGPPPPGAADAPDLVGDLRARDWITPDGALTLVGRHALARWCRTADDPASATPAPDAPHT